MGSPSRPSVPLWVRHPDDPSDPLGAFVADALRRPPAHSGHHNVNFVVPVTDEVADCLGVAAGTPVTVRLRRGDAVPVVVRTWEDEGRVLRALGGRLPHLPRFLGRSGNVNVQSHVEGVSLDTVCPEGTRVERPLVVALTRFMGLMATVPADVLPPLPDGPPAEGDDSQAYLRHQALLVHEKVWLPNRAHHELFEQLGVPGDAMLRYADRVPVLTRRPYGLLHGDLHRGNLILPYAADGTPVCVDWELAGYGDPLSDLAVHLVRMRYPRVQCHQVITAWRAALRRHRPAAAHGLSRDLPHYLSFERAQSVYPDVIRAAHGLGDYFDQRDIAEAAVTVARALTAAAGPLKLAQVPDEHRIRTALAEWRVKTGGTPADSRSYFTVHFPPPRARTGESGGRGAGAYGRKAVQDALDQERSAPPEQVIDGTAHRVTVVRGGEAVVRRRLHVRPGHGRRFLDENHVLRSLQRNGRPVRAPRVLAIGESDGQGGFALHDYVGPAGRTGRPDHPVHGLLPGEADALVDQLAALTDPGVLASVAELMDLDREDLVRTQTPDFYSRLTRRLVRRVRALSPATLRLAEELGLPDASTLHGLLGSRRVTDRSPALLHGDLNPWNLVRRPEDRAAVVLVDWELARAGDPLFDLVRHLHLTPTRPRLRTRMFARWERALPPGHTRGWQEDSRTYELLETVRSAYTDLDRMVTRTHLDAPKVTRAVASYARTLERAKEGLGLPHREAAGRSLLLRALPCGDTDDAAWPSAVLRLRDVIRGA
ncbi:phosphotransferase family protein [Streptomyces sp. bgisy022]|uniref:phosphotransferase family protein n=1 Tax=Streptomyces sp. bgisy022 TaxID=3413769 RepID=UPI003D723B8F